MQLFHFTHASALTRNDASNKHANFRAITNPRRTLLMLYHDTVPRTLCFKGSDARRPRGEASGGRAAEDGRPIDDATDGRREARQTDPIYAAAASKAAGAGAPGRATMAIAEKTIIRMPNNNEAGFALFLRWSRFPWAHRIMLAPL